MRARCLCHDFVIAVALLLLLVVVVFCIRCSSSRHMNLQVTFLVEILKTLSTHL